MHDNTVKKKMRALHAIVGSDGLGTCASLSNHVFKCCVVAKRNQPTTFLVIIIFLFDWFGVRVSEYFARLSQCHAMEFKIRIRPEPNGANVHARPFKFQTNTVKTSQC